MKKFFIVLNLSLWTVFCQCQEGNSVYSNLTGTYLGQTPPDKVTKFAPNIISGAGNQAYPSTCRNGTEFYYSTVLDGKWSRVFLKQTNNGWTEPKVIPFSKEYGFGEYHVSADGNSIVFNSRINPVTKVKESNWDLWIMERENNEWKAPRHLTHNINSEENESYPFLSASNDLYFFREVEGSGCDIYMSVYKDGEYEVPIKLGDNINSNKHDVDAVLSPDESYMIYCIRDGENSLGNNDLYISFKDADGEWTKSFNLGKQVNTIAEELTPHITSDGKYLFFYSNRNGDNDIYWVKTDFIKSILKQEKLIKN